MPAVPKSWMKLADAIGRFRNVVAHELHHHRDVVDKWCIPQPAANARDCDSAGRPSPVDEVLELTGYVDEIGHVRPPLAEHPDVLKAWIAERWGARLVYEADHPHDGKLLATPAILMAAVETFCRETNRRKPKLTADHVDDLADDLIDTIHAIKLRFRERSNRG